MARTDLRVTIDADAAKLEREVKRAERSMSQLSREIARGNREADRFAAELNQRTAAALQNVGRGMVIFGAAVVAGLGLAAKAAIDWESAWAGVRKTVEGTPEELAAVEAGLRDLATTLPATHQEIAAVAEAAGQLGIATPDVVEFTRVMIDLGETTNLTADEAATSIAQLMNVMQTAPQDVGRLGAALVELGNNGASTERDIIQMAQRIAGAGAIVGMSESDVLALANALASVGIEAQAGGTAISTAMIQMASAVAEGGDAVAGFADVAGMSAQAFAEAFERDPARAIQSFVAGLGRINAAGGNVFAVLDDLGLGSIRTRDALLRLAGAGDLLGQSLSDGARAWSENTALVEEAAKRYDTAEAKIAIARNTLVDLAIDVGGVLLPAITGLAEGAADIARWFGDLSGPAKTVATILAGLVGTVSLLGGGLLLLAPRLAAARAEMQLLSVTAPKVHTALTGLAKAGGIVAGLLAVATAIQAIQQASREAPAGIGETTKALLALADGVESDLIVKLQASVEEIRHQRERLQEAKSAWVEYKDSFAGTDLDDIVDNTGELASQFEAIDTALAGLVSGGNAERADEIVRSLADSFGLERDEIDQLLAVLPGYQDALAQASADQELAAGTSDELGTALSAQAEQAEAATTALKEYLDELRAATDPVFAVINALGNVTSAQDAYNEAVKENGASSDEARAAAVDLAEAIADMEQAVSDGDLSWADFDATLDRWVSQGVLTEGQAKAIRASTDEAREAMEDYEGDYPAALKLERDKAAERAAKAELDRIAAERRARVLPNLDGRRAGQVNSALNNLARSRSMTINVGYAVTGGGLPAGLVRGHSGGVPRFHDGGVPRFHSGGGPGLGPDEGMAILQTRERVLSREQNRAFEAFVNSFGSSTPLQSASAAGNGGGTWRITGEGPGFEWIAKGVRTGQLRLTANGTPVKVS
jgi:TP901 family phage tail tape measure protein